MSRYRIDPAGVQGVLKRTGEAAEGFETDLEPLPGYVESAAGACGGSGAIVPALDVFFTEQGKQMKAIAQQVNACLTGAVAATTAYNDADFDMMLTYQRNAGQAKISDIPK